MVGEDRVELSPRVSRTRMLRYTTPRITRMKDEDGGSEGSISSFVLPTSSFDTDHLFDLSDDFNQVFLILHHRFDRLVSAGNFIQHAYVFATFNARSLTSQIVLRKSTLGGTMR